MIVIDANGKVTEGSALRLGETRSTSVSPNGEIPDTPVEWRRYQCNECKREFRARNGLLMIHDCDRAFSHNGLSPLVLFVEQGGTSPLRATIEGTALAEDSVSALLIERGYRPLPGRSRRFSHFTTSDAVEELRKALEAQGVGVIFEEHRRVAAPSRASQ